MFFCIVLPGLVFAVPRPRPIEWVEHRIVKRHTPVSAAPPTIAFRANRSEEGLILHKVRGPETIEVLLGQEIKGDFVADLDIEIAGPRELGVGLAGGTPVPYFGFRSSDGRQEAYFFLSTYGGAWNPVSIQVRREKGKMTALRDRHAQKDYQPDIPEPGYVCIVMNDTSKVRIRHCAITPLDPGSSNKRVNEILLEK